MRHFLWFALALAACGKDEPAKPAKVDPQARPDAPPADELTLARPTATVGIDWTPDVVVIIQRDGALAVAAVPENAVADQGVVVAALDPAPVAEPDELAARLDALIPDEPPPPEPEPDDAGVAGPPPSGGPGISASEARAQALAAARAAGILDEGGGPIHPCVVEWGDVKIKTSLGHGTGHGSGYGVGPGGRRKYPAGLRARSVITATGIRCPAQIPLVLVDARAPAERVVEVLSALPGAQLGFTVDGDHARALAATFSFTAGNEVGTAAEVVFTVQPTAAQAAIYRGPVSDSAWTWSGDVGGLAPAYLSAHSTGQLYDETARLKLEAGVTAGRLVDALADLLVGEVRAIGFGEQVFVSSSRAPAPTVRIGQPTFTGEYDKATLRRYFKRNLPKIAYCYEKELMTKQGLSGQVATSWVIQKDGKVKEAKADGVDATVSSCIAGVLQRIEFPKPKTGEVVVTSYPLVLTPPAGK